jgi:hypothetical protein
MEAVRADRRLRTDEKAIRAQSAILYKNPTPSLVLTITVFSVRMAFHPYRRHGWRAQRASPLLACDCTNDKDAVYSF